MTDASRVRVAINGYGVIGKRVRIALKKGDLLGPARGAPLRRATDPWENHQSGIMNTLVPEFRIPSRHLYRMDAGMMSIFGHQT
jgi:glyceraldehyde-3-phosphate dehydrogenase (NAD(P))